MRPRGPIPGLLLTVVGVTCFLANAFAPYHRVIDDAYISYRYAKNLAQGHGLTWNPGEAPVEGYTNFLLVLVEAPFIDVGVDPLRVAQAYALLSVAGIAWMLWTLPGRRGLNGPLGAFLFLGIPFLPKHAVIGLETLTFSFHLVLAYWLFAKCVTAVDPKQAERWFLAACLASFVAGLSRPEGFAICAAMVAIAILIAALDGRGPKLGRMLASGVAAFGLPALAYHGWRFLHFGDLRPNSYYIKVAAAGGEALPGLEDLEAFVTEPAVVLLGACIAFRRRWTRTDALLLPAALFPIFYAFSKHIMAFDHRFFVPYVPFLVLPAAAALAEGALFDEGRVRRLNLAIFMLVFAWAFVRPSPAYDLFVHGRGGAPKRGEETHFMLGRLMAKLPDRHDLLVVGPDAGAMPYFSETRWIDSIGLNDNFLARNAGARKERLIDYMFARRPDIWILCKAGDRYVESFPGPLGNQNARIARDPRFARYLRVASFRKNSGGRYDYVFYARDDLEQLRDVERVLRSARGR